MLEKYGKVWQLRDLGILVDCLVYLVILVDIFGHFWASSHGDLINC